MTIYYFMAVGLNFIVCFLLIVVTAAICGNHALWLRAMLASVLNTLITLLFSASSIQFTNELYATFIVAAITSSVAFWGTKYCARKIAIYLLFQLLIVSIASSVNRSGIWSVVLAGGCLIAVNRLAVKNSTSEKDIVDVEITYQNKKIKLKALRDTGNFLVDPLTGRSVLLIGADVAQMLIGISKHYISNPIDAVASNIFPGLRLVPFKTVDQSNGMLLALKFQDVKIGDERGSRLVAFAPEGLTGKDGYKALTGGGL